MAGGGVRGITTDTGAGRVSVPGCVRSLPMSVPEPVSSPSALAGWFPEGSMAVPVQGLVFHELVVVRTKTIILRQAMDRGVLGGRDEKTLAAGAAELCIPLPVAAADDRSAVTGFTDCAVAHVVHVWHPPEWAISRARLQCAAWPTGYVVWSRIVAWVVPCPRLAGATESGVSGYRRHIGSVLPGTLRPMAIPP